MPPKKKAGGKGAGGAKPKKTPQPKPKRQLFANETVRKPQGASHGEVERKKDQIFK
jgi:hypothetical protein